VLLYDRLFLTGSFNLAFQKRAGLYVALASSWLLLLGLVLSTHGRGGSAGFGTEMSPWRYLLTQSEAIVHYLRLSAWPRPLIFDYGTDVAAGISSVLPFCLAIAILLGLTATGVAGGKRAGFLGACFFLILAPTSSIVPVATQTIAEHRMYLPLAAVVTAGVVGIAILLGRQASAPLLVTALGFSVLTLQRNETYRSELSLCLDTLQKRPTNPRAHLKLGNVLLESGDATAAVRYYQNAVRLDPTYIEAWHDLGAALAKAGRPAEAIPAFETTLKLHPLGKTYYAYAGALANAGRTRDAILAYNNALRLQPDYAEAHNNRGNLLLQVNDAQGAVADYEAALRARPDYVEAHLNLAVALVGLNRKEEALAQCRAALQLQPNSDVAHWKTGDVLLEMGRPNDAIPQLVEALKLNPSLGYAQINLGRALVQAGRPQEAVVLYERILQMQPNWALAHHGLATALAAIGSVASAIDHEEQALKLEPNFAEAKTALAQLRARAR
jgi:tetratricopeptide (TPR) repeat protein